MHKQLSAIVFRVTEGERRERRESGEREGGGKSLKTVGNTMP